MSSRYDSFAIFVFLFPRGYECIVDQVFSAPQNMPHCLTNFKNDFSEVPETALRYASSLQLRTAALRTLCSLLLLVVLDTRTGAIVIVVLHLARSLITSKARAPSNAVFLDLLLCCHCTIGHAEVCDFTCAIDYKLFAASKQSDMIIRWRRFLVICNVMGDRFQTVWIYVCSIYVIFAICT